MNLAAKWSFSTILKNIVVSWTPESVLRIWLFSLYAFAMQNLRIGWSVFSDFLFEVKK